MSALWGQADAETQAHDDEVARRAYASFQLNVTRQELRDERALRGAAGGEGEDGADSEWVLPSVRYDEGEAGAYHQCRTGRGEISAPFRAPLSPLDGRTEQHHHSITRNSESRPMEQTLALVRARLRAIRLKGEQESAEERPQIYGQDVISEVGEAASIAQQTFQECARTQTQSNATPDQPAPSLAEQIRNQHKRWQPDPHVDQASDSSMTSVFPSRAAHNPRQEVMQRWRRQNEQRRETTNSIPTMPTNNAATRGKRQRASMANDFQGLGLGEVMQNSSRIERRRVVASPALETHSAALTRRRGRPRPSISDFGGSLGDCLATVAPRSNASTDAENEADQSLEIRRTGGGGTRSSHRHASEWAGSGSLNDMLASSSSHRQRQPSPRLPQEQGVGPSNRVSQAFVSATNAVSVDDWGGSLGDILPRNRPVEPPPRRNSNRQQHSFSSRLLDADERLVEDFMAHGLVNSSSSSSSSSRSGRNSSSRNNGIGSRANFMSDSDLTYEMMMAFDDNLQNRRITVAAKSKATTPEALFKSLQNASYRSKKKKRKNRAKKKNEKESGGGEEEEEDDCAICLDSFSHRCSLKKWPCGHSFHTKCVKELLRFDTRCPLCRYDLVTGKHG